MCAVWHVRTWSERTKAGTSSAPGRSGTSFRVYLNCPRVVLLLWGVPQLTPKSSVTLWLWRVAEGVWITKEESSICWESRHRSSVLFVTGCAPTWLINPYRHISPDGWHCRNVRLPWTHQHGATPHHEAREQEQSVSAVVTPGKCLRLHSTQTGAAHTDKTPCLQGDQWPRGRLLTSRWEPL